MHLLPRWALLDPPSAIYDLESVTPLQQTARVYSKIQEMIREYNNFADQINKEIVEFVGSGETEISNFKGSIEKRIRCKFEEIDAALAKTRVEFATYSDNKIEQVYEQYLSGQMSQLISEMIANGEIDITLVYDPETESLNMTTTEV